MQRPRFVLLAGLCASLLCAHPMGNFSVNHYARILPHEGGADLSYVLDLAEIPTFELFQKWNLQATSPQTALDSRAAQEAREWVRNLHVSIGGHSLQPQLLGTHMTLTDGVGGMKVMRVEMKVAVKGGPGTLAYEDRNYAERAGWKEVVTGSGPDKSQALTAYPTDPAVPQPQTLSASVAITGSAPLSAVAETPAQTTKPAETAVRREEPQAAATPAPPPQATSSTPAEPESRGSLKRGDYLSTVLHGGEITFGVGLLCMCVAFGLGAMHAFEPGHGKTMVAAYLVGSRGTPKHAVLLGLMTTFTHTVSVFLLGFVTLFLSRYIMPEKMTKVLGVLSGLSIVWIGGLMLYRRSRKLVSAHSHSHDHDHDHDHHHHDDHGHTHSHSHDHEHAHAPVAVHEHKHSHDHGHDHAHAHHSHAHDHAQLHAHGHAHTHNHDHGHEHPHTHDHKHAHSHDHGHPHDHGHDHSHPHHHMPEGEITTGSLIALGVSGGMVPCPAALILLLTCISLGRPAFGMMLLLAFSVGLAIVLMATGLVVLYARHLLPEKHRHADSGLMRAMPVISAAVIVVVGVVMTGVSLGWLPAVRFLG